MDAQTGSPDVTSASARRARRLALPFMLAGTVSLLGVILFFVVSPTPGPSMAWLTPAELTRATHIGPATRLRYRLMNLTAPLWQWYWNRKPRILIDSRLLALTASAARNTGLGLPTATNAAGMRAWIVPSGEARALEQWLKVLPGVSNLSVPRIQTVAGMQASVFTGNSVGPIGKPVPAGIAVDLNPSLASGSVKLVFNIVSTEAITPASGSPTAVQTNFTVAAQVLVPNGGSLVIDGGNAKDPGGKSYWFIISPMATDTRGNLLKP